MEVDNSVLNGILLELKKVNQRLSSIEAYDGTINPKIIDELKLRELNSNEWLSSKESDEFLENLNSKINNG